MVVGLFLRFKGEMFDNKEKRYVTKEKLWKKSMIKDNKKDKSDKSIKKNYSVKKGANLSGIRFFCW